MTENKKLIDQVVASEAEELEESELGSHEHKVAIDGIVELVKCSAEIEKTARELELREQEIKNEAINNGIKNALTAFSIGSGVALTFWGTKYTTAFERFETATTTAGKWFIGSVVKAFTGKK